MRVTLAFWFSFFFPVRVVMSPQRSAVWRPWTESSLGWGRATGSCPVGVKVQRSLSLLLEHVFHVKSLSVIKRGLFDTQTAFEKSRSTNAFTKLTLKQMLLSKKCGYWLQWYPLIGQIPNHCRIWFFVFTIFNTGLQKFYKNRYCFLGPF